MHPARRTRLTLLVSAVPALLLPLAGCGATDSRPVAAQAATQSAPAGAWDEKTLVPAMQAAVERQESAHVSIRADLDSGDRMEAQGDVVLRGAEHDLVLTMDRAPFGTGSAEVRVVDGVLYLSVPPMTPEGKFVEIRPGDESSPFPGPMGVPHEVDPREMVAALESALREVSFEGEESVQGRQLGHYRLTLDPRSVAESAAKSHDLSPMSGRQRMSELPREVAVDVWLDEDALVHRVRLDAPRRGSLVVELSEWGEPVTIDAPSQRDVVRGSGW